MDPGFLSALRFADIQVDDSMRRRAEYSSDASIYRVTPTAVAFPRSASDVEAALSICRQHGVPLTPRGAGTSIAGNAIGEGLVLDFSRHMTKIHDVDPDTSTAVVDPGVILDDLQRAPSPHGLRFGRDPSRHGRCTMGGMIGNNACGSRAFGYGRTSDNILDLDPITGTGESLHLGAGASSRPPPFAACRRSSARIRR